jgi:hypothetical protein
LVSKINLGDFTLETLDVHFRQMRELEASGDDQIIDTLAMVVVYVAPCTRIIDTTCGLCNRIGTRKSQF